MQAHNWLGLEDGSRCCLGVLCDMAVEAGIIEVRHVANSSDLAHLEYGGTDDVLLPFSVIEWAQLSLKTCLDYRPGLAYHANVIDDIVEMNDTGCSFDEIASIIEESL